MMSTVFALRNNVDGYSIGSCIDMYPDGLTLNPVALDTVPMVLPPCPLPQVMSTYRAGVHVRPLALHFCVIGSESATAVIILFFSQVQIKST